MAEHRLPIAEKLCSRARKAGERRHRDPLKRALLSQDIENHRGRRSKLTVPEKIDNVVEVARSRALRERSDLFAEYLFIRVTPCFDATFRQVAVGMTDGSFYRRQGEDLIDSKIQLDAREIS